MPLHTIWFLTQRSPKRGDGVFFLGLLTGACVFFLGNRYLERQSPRNGEADGQTKSAGGMALILGAVLDGIPESIVLGLTLISGEGIGITVLIAILLSNLPEGIAGTRDLVESGWTDARITRIWTIVVVACAFASFAGYAVFGNASPNTIAFVQGFAGGAIIAMLTDSMIPEAYDNGGNLVGLVTAWGSPRHSVSLCSSGFQEPDPGAGRHALGQAESEMRGLADKNR